MSQLAAACSGVAHRRQLRALGVTRADVRAEVRAGRWFVGGVHTVIAGPQPLSSRGLLYRAVWESGSGAVLDGAAALVGAGMEGFTLATIDVSVPMANRAHRRTKGVTVTRRRDLGPVTGADLPRVRSEVAALRAAEQAVSDAQAVLLLCLPVQQRLVSTERLLASWRDVRRSGRRRLIESAVLDICDGARSLGELDFSRLCRQYGLPTPQRQVVVKRPGGRMYLDVRWDDIDLVVEIDGVHHKQGLNSLYDDLSRNAVVVRGGRVLRIPVLGLRLFPERFMEQVVAARRAAGAAA